MRYYIGVIHKDHGSDFGISFPDFPGCVSAGSDLSELAAMGEEALRGHVALMAEAGLAIPEPSSMDDVMRDPDNRDGTPVLVPAPAVSARAVRVNVTLPQDALDQIDRHAETHGFTRSGFLLTAARKAMEDA